MIARALAALACALFLAQPVFAQTGSVSGTVVDESNAVVPGAVVQLSGPQTRFATTGPGGDYSFRNLPPGSYQVTVTLSGFTPATVAELSIGASSEATVPPIALKIATLGETVVVSAAKVESRLIDAPVSMSVVSSDVLASTPAQNYGDLLRSIPGVNVIQLSARDINLTSRQATSTLSNSQLVLLDGRSIYLDFFGIVLWDFLPNNLFDVKQIEVIRGPASAVWGANALTGIVNVITKSPREARGADVTLGGGLMNRDAGSTVGSGLGGMLNFNATYADAPNDVWSYRVSAGYLNSDPLPRPTGQIPRITDPRDPTAAVGGAPYPADSTGASGSSFANRGTSQPRFDVRIDQEVRGGGRITYEGGVAGTKGIIYTGLGPFDIQSGSYMGYTKVNYSRAGLKVNFFDNYVSAEAPNLLLNDPSTGKPLQLNFSTNTLDFEVGDSRAVGTKQVFTFGGNVRRNSFDLTIAPTAQDRTELGGYVQDEIILDRVRFTAGARVDKFGNLSDPVFSPRLAAVVKAAPDHSFRVSFNRAFRSPSVINNYLDANIVVPTDLSGLAGLVPPALVAQPFPLVVRAVGSRLPIGATGQTELQEESLTAYEVAYNGTIKERTSIGLAFYVNDLKNNINFTQLSPALDPYTALNPPPGWQLPPAVLTVLAQRGVFLPRTAFTYLNLGPLRQKGLEVSLDHRIARGLSAYANYSWQADPKVLSDPNPFPLQELALPPTNRFNLGFSLDGPRFLGSATVSYSDRAFWSDVLTSNYYGFTDSYTMVGATFGMKWKQGRVTTLVRANNLLNQDIQQHVFGDILKASALFEVRFKM